jgi:hypothetical protein
MPTVSQHPYLEDDEAEEVWPPHDGQGPDVSNHGNERETTEGPAKSQDRRRAIDLSDLSASEPDR